MATAVLDLHLENLPPVVSGLEGYGKAFILYRYKSRPVGKTVLPVENGNLYLDQYHDKILHSAGRSLQYASVADFLQLDDALAHKIPPATVAICTRNRTDDLKRCLESLQKLPNDGQEIIVIDNCPSTDDTKKLVESYAGVRYIREDIPGLNWARNRAMLEAKNDIVAFTDDDALPDPGWLRALLQNFDNPLVACVTGMTMPLELETEGQEAFEKYSPFGKGFQRKVHSHLTRNPLNVGSIGAGANMAVRRDLVDIIGLFDEALDAGTVTQSGGDHEYFARILLAGYQIVYDPAALSWHRHRRTMEETKKAIKGYGVGVYAYWTRCLIVEKEFGILQFPWRWFIYVQLPNLARAIFRTRNSQPLSFVLAELGGCAMGPLAYIKSRRRSKKLKKAIL